MKLPFLKKQIYFSDLLWDCWCIVSIIGIWPRFIEPNLISTTKLNLKIKNLPPSLVGLKVLQFSDIHLNPGISDRFLEKVVDKVKKLEPDVIVFTGDFLCYSKLCDKIRLKKIFNRFSAPYGCYAIFGNHDYQQPVSINSKGEYDIVEDKTSMISKGFYRIFSKIKLAKIVTDRAKAIKTNQELLELIQETPFKILDNECQKVLIKESFLNICGVGEYTLGKCLPSVAFEKYDSHYPGLILAHNPDSVPLLTDFPGDLILCGHTHGGQINLPGLWKKFTLLENKEFKQGLFYKNKKWIYVNRGIGSVMQFRWFAMPEITCVTLEDNDEI
jgi:uncharacterized protein